MESINDRIVVGAAVLDGVVKNGRVGRQSSHRKFGDVVRQRAVLQQVASDVVEPETLASVVERLCGFHAVVSSYMARAW